MHFVQQLLLYISVTALLFLLLGLYKPWLMLWWEDIQNRRRVIKLYGTIAVVSYLGYTIINKLLIAS